MEKFINNKKLNNSIIIISFMYWITTAVNSTGYICRYFSCILLVMKGTQWARSVTLHSGGMSTHILCVTCLDRRCALSTLSAVLCSVREHPCEYTRLITGEHLHTSLRLQTQHFDKTFIFKLQYRGFVPFCGQLKLALIVGFTTVIEPACVSKSFCRTLSSHSIWQHRASNSMIALKY